MFLDFSLMQHICLCTSISSDGLAVEILLSESDMENTDFGAWIVLAGKAPKTCWDPQPGPTGRRASLSDRAIQKDVKSQIVITSAAAWEQVGPGRVAPQDAMQAFMNQNIGA